VDELTQVPPDSVHGTVNLGGGDDVFNSALGFLGGITGLIDGQGGTDTLSITGTGDDTLPASSFSGFETLNLDGTGTLIVSSGSTANFLNTEVGSGVLALYGTLGGNSAVALDGSLIGDGAILGNLLLQGTLAPSGLTGATGAAAGTGMPGANLTVGSLTVGADSALQFRQDAGGATDSVNVTGAATLNGGQVIALPQAGAYAASTDYLILSSGNLSGAFSGVTQDVLPFLDASLVTSGNNIYLRLTQANFNTFPNLPANQQSVADALQDLADAGDPGVEDLVSAARGVTAEQAVPMFDTLTGETYASVLSASRYGAERLQRSIGGQLDAIRNSGESMQCGGGWVTAFGGNAAFNGDGLANLNNQMHGLTAGVDFGLGDNFCLGGHVGAARADMDAPIRSDLIEANQNYVGVQFLYGTTSPFWLQGAAGYMKQSNDSRRDINVGVFQRTAHGDFDSNGYYAMVEGGWRVQTQSWTIEPMVGVYHNRISMDSFTETGADDANLLVESQDYDTTTVGAGIRFAGKTLGGKLTPMLDVRYLHDLGDDQPTTVNHFAAAQVPGFTITGFSPDRNRVNAGIGLAYAFTPAVRGFIEYRADLSHDDNAHSVQAGLRASWGGSNSMKARSAPLAPASLAPQAGVDAAMGTTTATSGGIAPIAAQAPVAVAAMAPSATAPAAAGLDAAVAPAAVAATGAAGTVVSENGGGMCKVKPQAGTTLDGCSRYTSASGDSVGGIANRMTDGVPEQRMVALFRGNPAAFNGQNMNQLKAGAEMGIPCADAVEGIPVPEAKQVIGQHARSYVKRHGQFKRANAGSAPQDPMQCGE
ncbi:MAG TPA: FimV/HubP family polar landmark protein, partial [Pseudoxanthomonas sp.]